jgi:hypothetical protein
MRQDTARVRQDEKCIKFDESAIRQDQRRSRRGQGSVGRDDELLLLCLADRTTSVDGKLRAPKRFPSCKLTSPTHALLRRNGSRRKSDYCYARRMAISSITVGNFKGLLGTQQIALKPITIFIGANSSGKSSTIHALASLAQTVNLPNNTRPLILDDQFAYVHLGRFIEIIHSKKYTDTITLGISGGETRTHAPSRSTATTGEGQPSRLAVTSIEGQPTAVYTFGSTKRTQDIFLKSAEIRLADRTYILRRQKNGSLAVTSSTMPRAIRVQLSGGFSVDRAGVPGRIHYMELQPLFAAQRTLEQELRKTLYLGPFREPPQRRYPTRGSAPREVGPRGEATVTLLANEMVQMKVRKHAKEVSGWLEMMGLARTLGVSRVGNSDLFDVNITLNDGSKFPLADLGYGFSQILPVLTQLSFAPNEATLLFEQPELHLHILAVRPLAAVFIDAVKKKRLNVVLETHSRELFGQFLREMREGRLDPADFVAYRVAREGGASEVTPIEIDLDTFDVYEAWEKGMTHE